jgi:hypothetical protein
LCAAIIAAGYTVWPIASYLTDKEVPERVVLLRHDIDRRPGSALRMAQLEHEMELRATYYVRMTRAAFRPVVLAEISALGHEVGYHYETLAKARGNVQRALALFGQELTRLRQVCDVRTASMHGAPLSPYDSRDLWQHRNVSDFDLLGEAYLSLDYEKLVYLTDTGRSWTDEGCNLRDRVSQECPQPNIRSTDDLISAIREHQFAHVCISAHPERWARNTVEWGLSGLQDYTVNHAKRLIALLRGQSDGE